MFATCLSTLPQNVFVLFRTLYLCGNAYNAKNRTKFKLLSQKFPILDSDLNIGSFILFVSFFVISVSFMGYVWTWVLDIA